MRGISGLRPAGEKNKAATPAADNMACHALRSQSVRYGRPADGGEDAIRTLRLVHVQTHWGPHF